MQSVRESFERPTSQIERDHHETKEEYDHVWQRQLSCRPLHNRFWSSEHDWREHESILENRQSASVIDTRTLTIQIGHRSGKNERQFRTSSLILCRSGKNEMILDRQQSRDLNGEKEDDVLVWRKRSRSYHSFDQSYEWIRRSSLRRSCKVEVDLENHFRFYEKQRSSFLLNQRKTNLACRCWRRADFRGMCCGGEGTIVFVATGLAGRVSVFDSSISPAFVSCSSINERRSWLILKAIRRWKHRRSTTVELPFRMGLVDVGNTLNVRIRRETLTIGSVVVFVVADQRVLVVAQNRSARNHGAFTAIERQRTRRFVDHRCQRSTRTSISGVHSMKNSLTWLWIHWRRRVERCPWGSEVDGPVRVGILSTVYSKRKKENALRFIFLEFYLEL